MNSLVAQHIYFQKISNAFFGAPTYFLASMQKLGMFCFDDAICILMTLKRCSFVGTDDCWQI